MRLSVPAVIAGLTAFGQVVAAPPLTPLHLDLAEHSAIAGNGESQVLIGHAYEVGDGVARDFAKAESWYRRAVESGHVEAQAALGLLLARDGTGIRNPAEAAQWLRLAAERGDRRAQFALGCLHANGEGVDRSADAAAGWFRRAAQQGDADAGIFLERIFPSDPRRAGRVAASHRATLAGLRLDRAAAEFLRGYMAETGWGVARDVGTAVRIYRSAAEAGQRDAEYRLARLHLDGRWVARDSVEAYVLFSSAAQRGHAGAEPYRAMLAATLSAAQRDDASVRLYRARDPRGPAVTSSGAAASTTVASTLARDTARPE